MSTSRWSLLLVAVAACVPPAQSGGGGGTPSAAGARRVTINGEAPAGARLSVLLEVEAAYATTLPDGDYWYDPVSGALGVWGGPTEVLIAAGLDLGPPVPANASGGGTGVFVNGRELHYLEVAYLQNLVGDAIAPGRYFIDAEGNAGLEGQAAVVNLNQLAAQRGAGSSGGEGSYTVWGSTGENGNRAWFESDGKCKYVMMPDGSSVSSGCN